MISMDGVLCRLALVLVAGKPEPVRVTVSPGLASAGSMIRVRRGIVIPTVPLRPPESLTVSGWDPGVTVTLVIGTMMVADQLPPLSTQTGTPSLKFLNPPALLDRASPSRAQRHLAAVACGVVDGAVAGEARPVTVMAWFGTAVAGEASSIASTMVIFLTSLSPLAVTLISLVPEGVPD